MTSDKHTGVRTVFLDIDDTLWENNIFFLQSLAWLCRYGRKHGQTDHATTMLLNTWEHHNIEHLGYGYDSYEASVLATVRQLVARSGRTDLAGEGYCQALRWTTFLRTHPIAWLKGVKETLPHLTQRFQTIIVTKGHPGDQMAKVNRCGLKHLFFAAEVVPHKNPADYKRLLAKYRLDPAETVMVGNSPRSDINQPRRAGLRTVYIPHPQTWFREMEAINTDAPKTIEIPDFGRLMDVLHY